MTGLCAHLRAVRGTFVLDAEVDVAPGEVVALLGPNGAGKTTCLRLLAGLLEPDGGRSVLDGRALDGLPPEQRRVGLVPQDGLLLPHLSALDNVAYGLRARGARKDAARTRAREELDRLGLGDRAGARPRELSGGQAQRVALARALATDPALLLLDEPLAALDALTRTDVRTDLRGRLQAFAGPALLVTHDPVDALVLADRLVVLEDGRVVQSGPPTDVAARPRTPYVAGLVGLELLPGTGRDGRVHLGGDAGLTVPCPDGPVHVAFAPQAVRLSDGASDGAWPVVVGALEQQGAVTRVRLDGPPHLTAVVPSARLDLRTGTHLWARVDPQDVAVYA